MSTDIRRTHGAQPPKIKENDATIFMAVRTVNKTDPKTGRSETADRKVFFPGQEEELKEALTADEIRTLEAGGYVRGLAPAQPSARSLSKDPTIMAGAKTKSIARPAVETGAPLTEEGEKSAREDARARAEADEKLREESKTSRSSASDEGSGSKRKSARKSRRKGSE